LGGAHGDSAGASAKERALRSWDLKTVRAEPHEPEILSTGDDARAILLSIPAGEELREHEVHEHARIVVIEGELDVTTPEGEPVTAAPGHLLEFVPGERHTVAARADARILLLLTPWPGDGHPGAMTLDEKADVRERAAERGSS
jgi:quercetin dioxygenase-like cupin family protein